jgi:hypothetical protein
MMKYGLISKKASLCLNAGILKAMLARGRYRYTHSIQAKRNMRNIADPLRRRDTRFIPPIL